MVYRDNARWVSRDAMFLGTALLLSYLEAILPLSVWLPLPGFKLGLCNILVTLVFVVSSPLDAAMVSFCRIFLMGLLFGNVIGFTFSLCGGVLSYLGLWLLARVGKRFFSMIGVSVGCAALHNTGQLFAAFLWFGTDAVRGYLPMLLIASLLFGSLTGVLLQIVVSRIDLIPFTKNQKQEELS